MIAIEVSSAAGLPPYGGIGGSIRNIVSEMVRLEPDADFRLCHRFSRWRKGHPFRLDSPRARVRIIQDPINSLLIPGARMLHSMSTFLPSTPSIPKVVTIYDLNAVRNPQWCTPEWHEKRSKRIRIAVSRADCVIATSEFMAAEIEDQYRLGADAVERIPLGIDRERYRPPSESELARVRAQYGDYVISIGLLTPRKNYPVLIEAMAELPELHLVLVGRGSDGEASVEAAIDRTHTRDRVHRLRGVDHDTLVALISGARVCAVPSLYEGFGLTVLEAMACGTPVVCSNASSLPEVAGDAAVLVDATDSAAIARAIARTVADSDEIARLRKAGLARAAALSWATTARRHLDLYSRLS